MNNDARQRWLAALTDLVVDEASASALLDARLEFTTAVARALVGVESDEKHIVYGVWLNGHSSPVYVGQSADGARRLWDLPIGESHHLSNSFPPETWERVVVVSWRQMLDHNPALTTRVMSTLRVPHGAADDEVLNGIGLGLEFLLQKHHNPLFNRRKKTRDGTWRTVNWHSAKSTGARYASRLGDFGSEVLRVWDLLTRRAGSRRSVPFNSRFGRVVYPRQILQSAPRTS